MPTPVRKSYKLQENTKKPFIDIDGFKSKASNALPSCESLKIKAKRLWIDSKEPERLNSALVYSFSDLTNRIILYSLFQEICFKNTDPI